MLLLHCMGKSQRLKEGPLGPQPKFMGLSPAKWPPHTDAYWANHFVQIGPSPTAKAASKEVRSMHLALDKYKPNTKQKPKHIKRKSVSCCHTVYIV